MYKAAADNTFASFLVAGPTQGPWVVDIDPSEHLWLQEYPGGLQCVVNGHGIAALGLYDYYRVTGDPGALALFQGAATTLLDYAAIIRQVGWRSLYCLVPARTANAHYHEGVVQQLLAIFTITGDSRFAGWADAFEDDYPRDALSANATITAGKHSIVRFAGSGTIIARRTISPRAALHPLVSLRRRIYRQPGYWLKIAAGTWKGYWIRESAPRVFVPGQLVTLNYSPSRTLTLPGGRTYLFQTFAPNGAVRATIQLPVTDAATIQIGARAIVNGSPRVCASDGPLAGYWVLLSGCSLN